ncbi:SDR family oxidoreductase [Streptococcus loxodontisalivarius]|uniref:NAD(P)H dehydrogenase (Quinone) n=1 Tax=Streptococcus loxodontisalivarius TaxID=1349415 RepID=A0ABS2PTG6_9STRE|nr:SDR family oxidoreductase [Streptococcus loxodontisalivarius]MBM7642667.1 NAD(P)H dehydrogenase (quinone) [Streptococcus loxodontisalivarius]
MTYLVTGVTGGLGTAILEQLVKKVPADQIAVLVRSEEKGRAFVEAGYDVRIGTYSDSVSLEKAFAGIETLIFVSGAPGQEVARAEQHKNVIEAAKVAGVANIAYTSISNGDQSRAILAPDHIATEKLLKESGLNYKILRNNWYFENELESLKAAAVGQAFVYAAGDSKVGWALRREYGEAIANAAAQPFTENKIYELAGKQITYAELAAATKEATDADFDVVSLSIEDYKASLEKAGLPEPVIDIVAGIQNDIRNHQLEVAHSDLEELLGHPQLSTVDAIKEVLS